MSSDLHIHTEFSCDSEEDLELYVKRAVELEMERICFTEHVDLNINDFGYRTYNPEQFFPKFFEMKEKYKGKIKLGAGIEFGEPHVYPQDMMELSKYPYDYVIGSIHWVGNLFPSPEIREKYSAKEYFNMHWEEVLKMVKHGGFDAVGHLDFPKRYYGQLYYEESKIKEIFKYLLEKDRVIEINTSPLRKGFSETMPDMELLEIYKDCGGRYITVGSDAHLPMEVGMNTDAARNMMKRLDLQEVAFENRKRISI